MADMTGPLGPQLLDKIQFGFIEQINAKFSALQNSSVGLLAIVATLEVVIFALAWMIKQDEGFGLLIIKLLKIGIFFFIVNSFPMILQGLLGLFIKVGYIIAPEKSQALLFSPGRFWAMGFKAGVSMMKVSAQYGSFNMGLAMMYLFLGLGMLLIFAAIGAQIIISVVLFYFVSVMTLIIVPLGVLKPLQDMFNRAIQHLIAAGVRLFAVILILGVSFEILKGIKVTSVSQSSDLTKPLALFFSSFILMILVYSLPALLARMVGKPGGNIFEGMSSPQSSSVNVASPAVSLSVASPVAAASSIHSVSSMASAASGVQSAATVVAGGMQAGNVNLSTNVSTTSQGAGLVTGQKQDKVSSAAQVNRSISDSTIRKIEDKL
ncbi:MAG: type IV secretion system protein [Francisellaceae bacterium]